MASRIHYRAGGAASAGNKLATALIAIDNKLKYANWLKGWRKWRRSRGNRTYRVIDACLRGIFVFVALLYCMASIPRCRHLPTNTWEWGATLQYCDIVLFEIYWYYGQSFGKHFICESYISEGFHFVNISVLTLTYQKKCRAWMNYTRIRAYSSSSRLEVFLTWYVGRVMLVVGGVARRWACRGGVARAARTGALFAAHDFYFKRHWLFLTRLFNNETGIEIS